MSTHARSRESRASRESRTNGGGKPRARASLPVRIVLAVLAAAVLGVGGFACLNLMAVGQFNQATATLTRNIKAAAKEDADLATLEASQQQTDAQFEDAAAFDAVLLPDVRSSIATNTEVSRKLTALIKQRLAEQQGTNDSGGSGGSSNGDSGAATDQSQGKDDGPALTDQQKAQIEQLLKANQQSTDTSTSTQQTDKKAKQNQTSKPW